MIPVLRLSAVAPKPIRVVWSQPGEAGARIDCTGIDCAVAETELPFTPTITRVGAADQGEFQIEPPTSQQIALCTRGERYQIRLVLRNALGAGVEDAAFWIVAQ